MLPSIELTLSSPIRTARSFPPARALSSCVCAIQFTEKKLAKLAAPDVHGKNPVDGGGKGPAAKGGSAAGSAAGSTAGGRILNENKALSSKKNRSANLPLACPRSMTACMPDECFFVNSSWSAAWMSWLTMQLIVCLSLVDELIRMFFSTRPFFFAIRTLRRVLMRNHAAMFAVRTHSI
jgi:hypothetical protein